MDPEDTEAPRARLRAQTLLADFVPAFPALAPEIKQFRDTVTPTVHASSFYPRGYLRSKEDGDWALHFAGTAERPADLYVIQIDVSKGAFWRKIGSVRPGSWEITEMNATISREGILVFCRAATLPGP
jgi:hypothetical protein